MAVVLLAMGASPVPAPRLQGPAGSSVLQPIGHGRISAVYDLDAAPPWAYALERQNLRVLDVRNPSDVREVASLDFEGPRVRSLLSGSHLYLVGAGEPLAVVDVSEPRAPRWLGEVPDTGGTIAASIVDGLLWVVRERQQTLGLEAFHLREEPGRPRRMAAVDLEVDPAPGFQAIGMSHDAGRLFILVNARGAARNEIVVVDLRTPAVESRVPLPEGRGFNDLVVRGDLFYLATLAPDGLAVYGPRDGDDLELLGSVTDSRLWYCADLRLHGDVIHASFKGDILLATFDVADPTRPTLVHAFVPEGWTAAGLGFSVADGRLYLSGDAGPSPIFDVTEPSEPRYLGRWDYRGGWAADVIGLPDGTVAVLDRWSGAYLYDVSDPRRPVRLARHEHAGRQVSLAAHGDRLLIASDSRPMEWVDVSDPSTLTVTGRFRPSGAVSALASTSRHALVAYPERRLEVIDLDDPANRVEFALADEITDVLAAGDRGLVAAADGSLAVIDLTGSAGPRIVARAAAEDESAETSGWWTTEVATSDDGELAITVRGEAGTENGTVTLTVFALRDESGLRVLGRLPLRRSQYAERFPIVASSGEVLVVLGRELVRVGLEDPREPSVSGRHALKTTMAIEGLARAGEVVYVGAAEDGLLIFELPGR